MLAFLLPYIFRLTKGPTIWDRVLALNLISVKVVIIIIIVASITNTSYLLNLAIITTLLWFICTIFIALFLRDRMKGGVK
jgi:multicomponent Na+:H+ antiporter subunit F